jgi:hypothetical protein
MIDGAAIVLPDALHETCHSTWGSTSIFAHKHVVQPREIVIWSTWLMAAVASGSCAV